MLQPVMHILQQKHIVLASGSPRRKELLGNIGLNVEICPSLFEENLDPRTFDTISDFVQETAMQKVLEVEGRLNREGKSPDLVIGADTIVTLGDQIFGKPSSEQEAFEMLSQLRGRVHRVATGVALSARGRRVRFAAFCDVLFGAPSDAQLRAYVASGEPMDKAGAYGVQGAGGGLVARVEGDYFAVVGLPLHPLCLELCRLFADQTQSNDDYQIHK